MYFLAYFEGIEITYNAILKLFKRYIVALEQKTAPKMKCMKEAFENLLCNPPQNTYEALLLSSQYWFLQDKDSSI